MKKHTREVEAKLMTFTCQWCKQTVTQLRLPSPHSYCSERCRTEARREQQKQLMRLRRAK
ncbi:hypothetical protein [Aphanothece hegewaldii]|uniref:hypothetical protein n=1 Tax=Aphanothece hegewaldii TaxID=1521625 RepID=UPI0015E650D9|nr:hypothetical protein [Aphanothece hegewaldii]